jgi:hypothetical protein
VDVTNPQFSDGTAPPLGLALIDQDRDQDGLDPDDDPAGGGAPGFDPDAPFGRFANGKPRKSAPGSRAGGKRPAGKRKATPPAPRKVGGRTVPVQAQTDYTEASLTLVGIAQSVTAVAGTMLSNEAFKADTATLLLMGPQLAVVSGELADSEARWASVLERVSTTSKWSPGLMVAFSLGMQLAVNHRLIPPGIAGTRSPEEVLSAAAAVQQEAEARAAQQLADRLAAGGERVAARMGMPMAAAA